MHQWWRMASSGSPGGRPPGVIAPARASRTAGMSNDFKAGDKVVWSSHGSDDTPGVVVRKITKDTEAGGRRVRASEDEPQYLVRSEKGGREAVHKPSALKRR